MAAKYFLIAFVAALSVQGLVASIAPFDRLHDILADNVKGNVGECLLAQKENIKIVGHKARDDIIECGNGIEGLDAIVAKIAVAERELRESIPVIAADLKACADDKCKLSVLKQAHNKLHPLLVDAVKLTKEAIELIETQGPEATKCVKAAAVEFKQGSIGIAKDLVACVKGN